MPEPTAAYIMEQVLEGLCYLHSRPQPILHRDIKPENILLQGDSIVKIADFGLSRKLHQTCPQSSAYSCVGTVLYMAPEVASATAKGYEAPYGRPADVWSAGVTFVEMLSGEAPWKGVEKGVILLRLVYRRSPEYSLPGNVTEATKILTANMLKDHTPNVRTVPCKCAKNSEVWNLNEFNAAMWVTVRPDVRQYALFGACNIRQARAIQNNKISDPNVKMIFCSTTYERHAILVQ